MARTNTPLRARRPGRAASRSALQDELARQILSEVGRDRLAPGTPIRELPLSKAFGVSRTPVRAALRVLEGMGFVTFSPGRGFTLTRAVTPGETGDEALPRSALDQLYDAIMNDRATGDLPAEVSEAALMPRYGVSRGQIRRVLMKLSDAGLARRQRGHGWRFVEALESREAVDESYRFRMIIECAALREPTFAADPVELQRLRDLHYAIIHDVEGLDPHRWFEANSTFHEMMTLWSRNRFLIEAMRRQNALRRLSEFDAFRRLTAKRILQSSREHLAILDAIESGDRDWAASLLDRHLALAARSYQEREAREARARIDGQPAIDPPQSRGSIGVGKPQRASTISAASRQRSSR